MPTSVEITTAIEERLGFVPPFFAPAQDAPPLLEHLWKQMLAGHLDNPLPDLFKEQLLAYLGRYCTVPYLLVCHSCALKGLGMAPARILTLLEAPGPTEDEVEQALATMEEQPAPLAAFPASDTALTAAVLRAAVYFFLNRDRAARCRAALRRLLGETDYNNLMALLAHAKASQVWVEAHPELGYDQDRRAQRHLAGLVGAEPRLAELFRAYRERARREYRRLEERLVAALDQHRRAEAELRRKMEQLQVIHELSEAVSRADAVEEIYRAALDGLERSLGSRRASILLYDADDVMRFKAWRGLSDAYRRAVEGHSPWERETADPRPLLVPDVLDDPSLAPFLPTIQAEGIRAMAFIPLLHRRRLLGKFMVYFDSPHPFAEAEVQQAQSIASHVGFAIGRRQAEEERGEILARERRARTQAEEASRAKDEFLATISHELRTPLTAMLAWPVILRGKAFDQAAVARGLEIIERNAKLQAQIIEDLLEVSRIITGKLRLDLRPLELAPLVEAAIDAVRSAADAKGVELRTLFDERVGPVQGDPDRLQQILWNLLSNAIKFTPAGGHVEVRLRRTAAAAEVSVEDDGMGISPGFLPYVFDRFRQADSSTTRQHGGLGLGLAIVRHLVEMHGGAVRAESRGTGQGSTFTIELPLASPVRVKGRLVERPGTPAGARAETAVERAPALAGLRLLVVDDEPDTLEMLHAVLTGYGAEVTAATSAGEALAALRRAGADALISDIGMPGEDGYSLIRKVRSLGPERGVLPAVALTAYARREDRERALAAGYQVHVPKPVDPLELAAILEALVQGRDAGLPAL